MNQNLPDPERLREDLQKILGEAPEPSRELRARVLDHARRRKRSRPAPRPRWRLPAAAGTIAAAALVVLLLNRPDAPGPVPEPAFENSAPRTLARAAAPGPAGDLNRDGRVDILDAWRLAHALEAGSGDLPAADLDADGALTDDDLDRMMRRIVRLGGGAS